MKKVRLLIYSGDESWIRKTLAASIPSGKPAVFVPEDAEYPPCTILAITNMAEIMEALKDADLT